MAYDDCEYIYQNTYNYPTTGKCIDDNIYECDYSKGTNVQFTMVKGYSVNNKIYKSMTSSTDCYVYDLNCKNNFYSSANTVTPIYYYYRDPSVHTYELDQIFVLLIFGLIGEVGFIGIALIMLLLIKEINCYQNRKKRIQYWKQRKNYHTKTTLFKN